MFTGQINPNSYVQDVGQLHILLSTALGLIQETWLHSPHWDQPPTKEMMEAERRAESRMVEAGDEVIDVAAEIFLALTGKKIRRDVLNEMRS